MPIVAYIILLLAVFLGITSIPTSIIGGMLARLTKNTLISMLVGSLITWFLINFIWMNLFSSHIPILAIGLSCLAIFFTKTQGELNENAKYMASAEQWSLIILAIYIFFSQSSIHWY